MRIRISLDHRGQHLIGVEAEFDVDGPVVLAMPVWTPGSYLVREYARHVEGLTAVDASSGRECAVTRAGKNRYRVDVPAAASPTTLRVRYRVYAHELTVRTAFAGTSFAYWSGAPVHLWPVGREAGGATIEVDCPDGWELHVGEPVVREGTRRTFRVRDLDHAVDTPVLVGPEPSSSVTAAGATIRIATAGLDGVSWPATFERDVVRVVEAAAAVFGGSLPFDDYVFLCLFADQGRGGLEHATSTTLLAPRTSWTNERGYQDFLGLVAHEFFHVWNVKRMRPAELWSFDYERENHTELLWVAEGFTAYFDDLLCRRTGIVDASRYLEILTGHVRSMHKMPGRFQQSLAEASYDAWTRFYRPDENTRNSTQNYYSNGALAALCFDAAIRDATDGERSLDDAVRALFERTYGEGRGYTAEDVVACLSDAAGRDLGELVETLTRGPFDPDLDTALGVYGLRWEPDADASPRFGIQFRAGTTTISSVMRDGPAWLASLSPGDELLAIEGLRVQSKTWNDVVQSVATDREHVSVLLARAGVVQEHVVRLQVDGNREGRIREIADADARSVRLRAQWLAETESASTSDRV